MPVRELLLVLVLLLVLLLLLLLPLLLVLVLRLRLVRLVRLVWLGLMLMPRHETLALLMWGRSVWLLGPTVLVSRASGASAAPPNPTPAPSSSPASRASAPSPPGTVNHLAPSPLSTAPPSRSPADHCPTNAMKGGRQPPVQILISVGACLLAGHRRTLCRVSTPWDSDEQQLPRARTFVGRPKNSKTSQNRELEFPTILHV